MFEAEGLKPGLDILVLDGVLELEDALAGEVREGNFGANAKAQNRVQIAIEFVFQRRQFRRTDHLVGTGFHDLVMECILDQFLDHLHDERLAIELFEHRDGHFARTEAFHLYAKTLLPELVIHMGGEFLGRRIDDEFEFDGIYIDRIDLLNGGLHGVRSDSMKCSGPIESCWPARVPRRRPQARAVRPAVSCRDRVRMLASMRYFQRPAVLTQNL